MNLRAVIIAGGFGTRMRPLSLIRPKPLIPLANLPILAYQVQIARSAGVTEVVFATNYLADQIIDYFGDGSQYGVKMFYRVEPEPMGTGGAIRYAVDGLEPTRTIVFNGDILSDFQISDIVDFHISQQAKVTLTLYKTNRPHPFGVVNLDEQKHVVAFVEPSKEQKLAAQSKQFEEGTDLINAGIYIIEPDTLMEIPKRKCSIEREFFPILLTNKAPVYGYEGKGFWIDIGRPAQLLLASHSLLQGSLKLQNYMKGSYNEGIWFGDGCQIDESARISSGCNIGTQAVIKKNAVLLSNNVIGESAVIGEGSILDACLVMNNVNIGSNCNLTRCIIDSDCIISNDVRAADVVLGAGTEIKPFSTLGYPIT